MINLLNICNIFATFDSNLCYQYSHDSFHNNLILRHFRMLLNPTIHLRHQNKVIQQYQTNVEV